jgi:hypothetical protein
VEPTLAQDAWYSRGFAGVRQQEERQAASIRPNRIWLKKGSKRDFIFVDDEPFTLNEHNYYADGHWKNWMTCAQGIYDETVCCDRLGRKSRHWLGYFTVIDCNEWEDQQGNKHKYEMSLYPAKLTALKILESRRTDLGTLAGAMFSIARIGEKSPGCGDDFNFKKIVDLGKVAEAAMFRGKRLRDLFEAANRDEKEAKILKQRFQVEQEDGQFPFITPALNYMEILKPKTPKEMKDILRNYRAPENGNDRPQAAGGAGTEDDVPF